MTITTNHQPRAILCWNDLTAKEQREFDYLEDEQRRDEASFVRYRGWVYDLSEFRAVDNRADPRGQNGSDPFGGWDGFRSDSYFSGVLVRFTDDGEGVVLGTFYT